MATAEPSLKALASLPNPLSNDCIGVVQATGEAHQEMHVAGGYKISVLWAALGPMAQPTSVFKLPFNMGCVA